MEWVALYKFARLAFLALGLLGIFAFLYLSPNAQRFEEPARRMLEEDEDR